MYLKPPPLALPTVETAIYGRDELSLYVYWPDGSHTAYNLHHDHVTHKHFPIKKAPEVLREPRH